jgi:hypothetical protein
VRSPPWWDKAQISLHCHLQIIKLKTLILSTHYTSKLWTEIFSRTKLNCFHANIVIFFLSLLLVLQKMVVRFHTYDLHRSTRRQTWQFNMKIYNQCWRTGTYKVDCDRIRPLKINRSRSDLAYNIPQIFKIVKKEIFVRMIWKSFQ